MSIDFYYAKEDRRRFPNHKVFWPAVTPSSKELEEFLSLFVKQSSSEFDGVVCYVSVNGKYVRVILEEVYDR